MSNETVRNISAQSKATNALAKVDELWTHIFGVPGAGDQPRKPGALESLAQGQDRLQEQLTQAVEVIDTLVKMLGVEQVEKSLVDNRIERAKKKAAGEQAQVAAAVESGKMKVVDVIGPDTYIAGTEVNSEGKVTEPGWFFHGMNEIKPAAREELIGKSVGTSVKTDAGNTFTVIAAYELVPLDQQPTNDGPKIDSTVETFAPSIKAE